jgi:hypothetical protein
MPEIDGNWPNTKRRVLYDFMTANRAPAMDGIVPPDFEPPPWIDHVATLPGSLDVVRRAREQAEGGAKTAEDKASRLLQLGLALLTIALALGSYQLEFALSRPIVWSATLIPMCIALAFLSLAAFEASQIDRVGIYSSPDGSQLANATAANTTSILLVAEDRGRRLASWSSRNKHSDLMQARAWFTRGLAALLIAGLVAGITRASTQSTQANPPTTVTITNDHHHGSPFGPPRPFQFRGNG